MSCSIFEIVLKSTLVEDAIHVHLSSLSILHIILPPSLVVKLIVAVIVDSESLFFILFPLAQVYLSFRTLPNTIACLFAIQKISFIILIGPSIDFKTKSFSLVIFPLPNITWLISLPASSLRSPIVGPISPVARLQLRYDAISFFIFLFVNFAFILYSLFILNYSFLSILNHFGLIQKIQLKNKLDDAINTELIV